MRTTAILPAACLLLLSLATSTLASAAETDPELNILTTFANDFNIVRNGERNRVVLSITNPADRALSLEGITGAFLNKNKKDGQKGRVLRNMTTQPFKSLPLPPKRSKPLQVPFDMYPEFKPGDVEIELRVLVTDNGSSRKYNLNAYQGKVKVEEPPKNWFDLQLLSLYAMLIAGFSYAGYVALSTYFTPPQSKREAARAASAKKAEAPVAAPAPVASSSATSAAGYQEEWIPESHLKTPRPTSPTRRKGGKK
ncbi:unnamed protein product [Tilletia controversa]|uniref:Translocon-associated protein subunit alpha n=3 Tax=Tilletia TaxID=13289 RepID=A0A8X7MZ88_9BASI|nr:hypothetical protein CF336_g451 [Tilletia laevis]KAE8205580.1 hypothetical protein CF328_g416 [Tilletia controversa]KAE8265462.1 hypothetical protein A4X03_0g247 [Tilletia caries]KAE8208754.1 hypothetical protein CF335_g181 [Tilletia laevis]KAE8255270.1 hypothetical protein A4X06_0g512 [Tilletia controversa]